MADLTTLATVKAWLDISAGTHDVLLQRLISAASAYLQGPSLLGRTIAAATYTETRDGTGSVAMMFANYPVTAVSAVTVDGVALPVSNGVLSPGYAFNSTRIILRQYLFTKGMQNVTLAYTAGFANTPADVEQACVELIGLRFKDRDRIGITAKGLAGETISFSQRDHSRFIDTAINAHKRIISV